MIEKDIVNRISSFPQCLEHMQMVAPKLNPAPPDPFGEGDSQGAHPPGHDLVISGLDNQVHMVTLQRKMKDPQSPGAGVLDGPLEMAQTGLISDPVPDFEIYMKCRL
jgi:hypothetical protein